MAEAKSKAKTTTKAREMRPSTLLNHIEDYCKENDLGQDDTIGNLQQSIEQDIVAEARRRG
jgi:hypothetical protein